jgi:protein-S-isoprenylcysteine O-methyltransferase Ste14
MRYVLFSAVVVSAATLVGALVLSIAKPTVSVWPAPQEKERAWRARLMVHRVTGALVALAGVGALCLAVLDRGSLHLPARLGWLIGLAILAFGATFGLWGYLRLGPSASQGALAPLEASGPYRYSRNPQYVGAIAVLLGFALLCASKLGLLAGAACSIWFITAPFAEEPWLRRHLGVRYDEYAKSSPRYLGFARRRR